LIKFAVNFIDVYSSIVIINLNPLIMKNLFAFVVLVLISQIVLSQRVALVRDDGKFGYIKEDGSWFIEPGYEKAGNFSDGMAAVFGEGKWGYIDSNNQLVIDYQFDKVKGFNSGIAVVSKDKRWFYIDKTGNEITTMPASDKVYDFKKGYAFIKRGEDVGIINAKGDVIIEPAYKKIFPVTGGYAKVQKGDLFGLVDKAGKVVLEPVYQDIGEYSNGVLKAKKDDVVGIIIEGKFTPVEGAIKIWNFDDSQNLTYAQASDKKIGFIDRTGKWVIGPKFKKARRFHKGLAPAMSGKLWGYIDESGNWKIEEKFKDAEIFSDDGLAPVKVKKAWGFINTKGELVIEDIYGISANSFNFFEKQIIGFNNGLARVKSKKGWGFLNTKGESLNDTWYTNAESFVDVNK